MKFLVPLFLMILLISCGNSGDRSERAAFKSDSILSREIMIRLLVDIHLVEAALAKQRNEGKEDPAMAIFYYKGIFQKYGVTYQRVQYNLEYYRKDPAEFVKMYEKVIALISERQKNYEPSKSL